MRILVAANHVPFMSGGANYHINGLVTQLKQHGHEVECLRFPFHFTPEADLKTLMSYCGQLNVNCPNGKPVDKLISLQFPAYGLKHDNHAIWVMHQHRVVYELFDEKTSSKALKKLRPQIIQFDNSAFSNTNQLYANSKCVANRIKKYNDLSAQHLYHPPFGESLFFNQPDEAYIFCPSRLEKLKRQDLLITAAKYLTTPVNILIAGNGGQLDYYKRLIHKYKLEHRVRLLGNVSEAEKLILYSKAMAVFFAPYDEDYGYITLESMLSSKPVISCNDSGGPLEFIEHEQNGLILNSDPKIIAKSIDQLYNNRKRTQEMGVYARESYLKKEISWEVVIQTLLT